MDLKSSLRILMCCLTLSLAITTLANSIPTITFCGPGGCNYSYGFPYAASYNNYVGKNSEGTYYGGFIQNVAFWFIVVSVCAYLIKKYDLFETIKPKIPIQIKSWQIALLSPIPYLYNAMVKLDITDRFAIFLVYFILIAIMLIPAILLRINKTKPMGSIVGILIGLLGLSVFYTSFYIIMPLSLFLASFYYFWKEAPNKE